jgi:hypothetical protein
LNHGRFHFPARLAVENLLHEQARPARKVENGMLLLSSAQSAKVYGNWLAGKYDAPVVVTDIPINLLTFQSL